MTSKLTVYIEDSVKRQLKEEANGSKSLSELVNDALESYLSAQLINDFATPYASNEKKGKRHLARFELPSLSEVKKRRPRISSTSPSSAEIISELRSDRIARISR
jgi:hypothetical protein